MRIQWRDIDLKARGGYSPKSEKVEASILKVFFLTHKNVDFFLTCLFRTQIIYKFMHDSKPFTEHQILM